MFRNSAFAVGLALLAGTTAYAAVDKVADVVVEADLSVVKNEQAAAYWANLATDLETALVERLVDRIAEDGVTITVDLSEVELASSFERAIHVADAVLVGSVKVAGERTNADDMLYDLSVSLDKAPVVAADGTTLLYDALDTPEAYHALIAAFASAVVKRLD